MSRLNTLGDVEITVDYKLWHLLIPFPKQQIFDSSKLKKFGDNNFKFDENDRKFSKKLESTVGKGEIARYEQFLLFPKCFRKISSRDT